MKLACIVILFGLQYECFGCIFGSRWNQKLRERMEYGCYKPREIFHHRKSDISRGFMCTLLLVWPDNRQREKRSIHHEGTSTGHITVTVSKDLFEVLESSEEFVITVTTELESGTTVVNVVNVVSVDRDSEIKTRIKRESSSEARETIDVDINDDMMLKEETMSFEGNYLTSEGSSMTQVRLARSPARKSARGRSSYSKPTHQNPKSKPTTVSTTTKTTTTTSATTTKPSTTKSTIATIPSATTPNTRATTTTKPSKSSKPVSSSNDTNIFGSTSSTTAKPKLAEKNENKDENNLSNNLQNPSKDSDASSPADEQSQKDKTSLKTTKRPVMQTKREFKESMQESKATKGKSVNAAGFVSPGLGVLQYLWYLVSGAVVVLGAIALYCCKSCYVVTKCCCKSSKTHDININVKAITETNNKDETCM